MQRLNLLLVVFLFFGLTQSTVAQEISNAPDSLGLPGDNFILNAVLFKFQQCKTLEEFEQELNKKENQINNLDLNKDNEADYIKVEDHVDGTTHAISMKAVLSKESIQDIAVIIVDKDASGNVSVQAIGDEDLYGKDYIIEPADANNASSSKPKETPNPGYKPEKSDTLKSADGQNVTINNYYQTTNNTTNNTTNANAGGSSSQMTVSVNYWPMWGTIYGPSYVVYVSPYYYGYYPVWYHPYPPVYFHSYYMYHRRAVYYHHYAYNHHYHNNYYHNNYYPNHRESVGSHPAQRPANPGNSGTRPGSPVPPSNGQGKPSTKPATPNGNSRPSTQPATPPNGTTRPSTQPSTPKGSSRPSTQPATPPNGTTRPSTQPSTPNGNSRPSTQPSVNPGSNPKPSQPSSGGYQNQRSAQPSPQRSNNSRGGGGGRRR